MNHDERLIRCIVCTVANNCLKTLDSSLFSTARVSHAVDKVPASFPSCTPLRIPSDHLRPRQLQLQETLSYAYLQYFIKQVYMTSILSRYV